MKTFTIFGIDFTPRALYRDYMEELKRQVVEKDTRLWEFRDECVRLTKEYVELKDKYEKLLKKQPKHGKDGKFVKKGC